MIFLGLWGIRKCVRKLDQCTMLGPFIVGGGVIILIVITVFSFRVQLRTSLQVLK